MPAGSSASLGVLALGGKDPNRVRLPEFALIPGTTIDSIATNLLVTWSARSEVMGQVNHWIERVDNSPHAHRVVLRVPESITQDHITVEVEADGNRSKATIEVVAALPDDHRKSRVRPPAPTRAGDASSVRLAVTDGAGFQDSIVAFHWMLDPATILPNDSKLVALVSDYARLTTHAVSDGVVKPDPDAYDPYRLPVRLWLATEPPFLPDEIDILRARIRDELALANEILRANRIGIELVPDTDSTGKAEVRSLVGYEEPEPAEQNTCPKLKPRIGKLEPFTDEGGEFAKVLLHVFYLPYSGVGAFGARGRMCTGPGDGTRRYVAVFRGFEVPSILAHELAHALGLARGVGEEGHTTGIDPFDPGNVMWEHGKESLQQAHDRSRLSVGQAMWMTLDSTSHLGVAVQYPDQLGSPKVRSDPQVDCKTDPQCAPQELVLRAAQ